MKDEGMKGRRDEGEKGQWGGTGVRGVSIRLATRLAQNAPLRLFAPSSHSVFRCQRVLLKDLAEKESGAGREEVASS